MEHLHLCRSIWKGILLKPTIQKIFGNLSYKMSWEQDSDCHKLHSSLISTTNFSWPQLNCTNLNQAEWNLWCIFNTHDSLLSPKIFLGVWFGVALLYFPVSYFYTIFVFLLILSVVARNTWSQSFLVTITWVFQQRFSAKKRCKNSPSSQLCCISPLGSGQSEFSAVITAWLLWIFPWAAQTCWRWGWPTDAWPSTTCGAGRTPRCWTAGQPGAAALSQPALQRGTPGQPLPP